jgi:hypothetical protein
MLMKKRFRLVDRKDRGFYCLDNETGKRISLKSKSHQDAEEIVFAKNQAIRQPTLNRQIAKAYLSGIDPGMSTRTWQMALEAMVERKFGATRERWERGIRNSALDLIRHRIIVETQAEELWQTLKVGISVSVFREFRFKKRKVVQLSVKVSVRPSAMLEFRINPAPFGITSPLLFNGFAFVSVK